ncbi:MAG: GNAT family N-acetyltransferase [Deltaproteobacteria bacterium]|nr:GNAT family N-acetyltransferase [Deltaproteobacteria bacterium]
MARYIELLRLGFSEGPGREDTVDSLLRAARLYERFFLVWKCLSFLQLFPNIIPEIFVCEIDGQVVGAHASRRRGNRKGPFSGVHVAVDPAFRKQGIAYRMFSHRVSILDPSKVHFGLAKVREENEPQIKNIKKIGGHFYARQMRFSLDPDSWYRALHSEIGKGIENPSLTIKGAVLCRPKWAEIRDIKARETPEEVRRIDPVSIFPFGRPPDLSTFLINLFLTRHKWKGGVKIDGQLVACGILFYDRLQRSYELDLSALPRAKNAVYFLLRKLIQHISKRPKAPINVVVRDYQQSVVEALEETDLFSIKGRYLLDCKKMKI